MVMMMMMAMMIMIIIMKISENFDCQFIHECVTDRISGDSE
jgi:hypothetical protein